jgi:predicted small metal-binding protein
VHHRPGDRHRAAGAFGVRLFRPTEDIKMARKYIDCRHFPSDAKCSVAISADTEDELVEAAAQHAVAVHKHQDSPQLRQQIRSSIREGDPVP